MVLRLATAVVVAALAATPRAGVLTTSRVPPCASVGKHTRWSMKNRPFVNSSTDESGATETYEVTVVETTVADVIAMDIPPAGPDADNQPQNDFERTMWHMPAFACLVKQSPDDCDLHVEVAGTPETCLTGPRMIVELPASYGKEAQDTLLDALDVKLLGRGAHHFLPTNPPAIQVYGWGFFDYAHRCERDPHDGCNHGSTLVGTLAELHPARVEAR